jgi:hypothetical protein
MENNGDLITENVSAYSLKAQALRNVERKTVKTAAQADEMIKYK